MPMPSESFVSHIESLAHLPLKEFERQTSQILGFNFLCQNAATSLHGAVLRDEIETTRYLSRFYKDNNSADHQGCIPLHYAAMKKSYKMVKILISAGACVNAKDNKGKTPLHYAVCRGSHDVAELLIAKGADVNARDNVGIAPVHIAAFTMRFTMVELLLSRGANASATDHANNNALTYYVASATAHKIREQIFK